ncbi:unnamed protein product [Peronospora effusa]|nr:unnamed protein product [Peronospora effusa]
MNYAFDCILGIPWLSRYQPKIDWLSRSVKRRSGYDVSEVFTHLLVASSDWPHVRVLNELATTSSQHRDSDGPLCAVCSVTLTEPQNEAVEQRFPHTQTSVEQGFPMHNEAVEQRFPHTQTSGFPIHSEAVEQILPRKSTSDEQRLSINIEVVEQELSHTSTSDAQRLLINIEADEQGIPRKSTSDGQRLLIKAETVDQWLPQTSEAVDDERLPLIDGNGRTMDPHEADVVETELPRLDGERFVAQSWDALRASGNPVYDISREYADIFPEKIPAELPADRGVRHEIDLVPGSNIA